jgi:tetratricopeptide (TPR) repeat protein
VWQKLYNELKDQNFMVIAVAMDSRGVDAVRGPITKAKTTYTSLVDRDHLVSDLYNMVNVPQAVWIDEAGRIVRPTEVSGFALTLNLLKARKTREVYFDAIRDWVKNGDASPHAYSEADARAHLPAYTAEIALAHASFHLGQHLWNAGNRDEGERFLRKATELNPDSWNFFRQMKNLGHKLGSGGPEYMARVRKWSKEGNKYYPLPDIEGIGGAKK